MKTAIDKYLMTGLFPDGYQDSVILQAFCYKGHPTAEGRVISVGEFIFIGQPVCRASGWYRVPVNDYDNFRTEWNSLGKKPIGGNSAWDLIPL